MLELNGIKYYTPIETAQLLDRTPDFVRKQCKNGKLEAEILNGKYFISKAALQEFCKKERG